MSRPKNHNPRYLYDCDRCKFNWCCGPLCACALNLGADRGFKENPKRQAEVEKLQHNWRKSKGYTPEFCDCKECST